VFSDWVWLEMKNSPEMVWPDMVGPGWVSCRRGGEGGEEEKNHGKKRV
jgi:hypothetical protein